MFTIKFTENNRCFLCKHVMKKLYKQIVLLGVRINKSKDNDEGLRSRNFIKV